MPEQGPVGSYSPAMAECQSGRSAILGAAGGPPPAFALEGRYGSSAADTAGPAPRNHPTGNLGTLGVDRRQQCRQRPTAAPAAPRARRDDVRNIAIIAHVDHGKTTLVDAMLWQSGIFRANEAVAERVMDSIDLEREKGITIMAKNTAIHYRGTRINIVDTPGHADFGGEVERTLTMVDGVMLLVDASEGPLPQTRFVLRKALERGLPPIVVINKIDRPDARADGGARRGLRPLHRPRRRRGPARLPGALLQRPQGHLPAHRPTARTRRSSRSSSDRRAPCRRRATTRRCRCSCSSPTSTTTTTSAGWRSAASSTARCARRRTIARCRLDGGVETAQGHRALRLRRPEARRRSTRPGRATSSRSPASTRSASARRSPTSSDPRRAAADPRRRADHRHGLLGQHLAAVAAARAQYVTSPQAARSGSSKELLTNVAIRVEATDTPDAFQVSGRGELQLAILIEMMRREGYELSVGKPEVITRDDRRRAPRADGAAGRRLPRGVHRRRHPEGRHAARPDDEDGQPRHRPRAAWSSASRRAG